MGLAKGLGLVVVLSLVPLARAQSDAGTDATETRGDVGAPDPFRQLVDSDPFAGDEPVEAGDEAHADPLASEGTADLRTAALPAEDELVGERLPVVRGEVLSAIAGVREVGHRTHVELVAGLALVRTELRFESSARHAAELAYRVPVPQGAVPFAVEVCQGTACRTGTLDGGAERVSAYDAALIATGPLTDARPIAVLEREGDALVVRAAPIPAAGVGGDGAATRGALLVRIAWAAPVPVHGGVARLTLPARGHDVRAASEQLSLDARDLVVPEVDGLEVSPGEERERGAQETVIVAHVPRTWTRRSEAWGSPCRGERCVWVRASTERPEVARQDVILAIDASPSTAGGARGLVPEAALSILTALPRGSRVRVAAFAARAEVVLDAWTDATAVEEASVRRATELELGSATRFEALWSALAASATRGSTIVWIGDGGLTSSDEGRRALEEARARGVSLRVINVADRPSATALVELASRFGTNVEDVHREALLAARNRREALDERMLGVLASATARRLNVRGLGADRILEVTAGSAATAAARVRGRADLSVSGERVAVASADGDLALAVSALGLDATRVVAAEAPSSALACGEGQSVLHGVATLGRVTALPNRFAVVERRACRAPAGASAATTSSRRAGLSRPALLRTLRQRIMPRARDCFRSDRRGRAQYSTEVQLFLTLADQEIVDVRAEGAIEPDLRACMVRAADALEVPPFEGVIVARWPLYSRPELAPPTLELHPDLASAVDAIAASAAH